MSESANFSNIYKFYDSINSLFTLGFDKSWREKASKQLIGSDILDLGSGTGAAYQFLKNFNVTALDPDENMLRLNLFSKKVVAKAENLPFEDASFDSVYCAFVWRNLTNANKVLSEVFRILKPGGKFVLLDMTRPKNNFLKRIHKIGTFKTTLLIGVLTTKLTEYRFLHKSLDKYPQPEINLLENPFHSYSITRMGLFGFVYLAVFDKL